MTGEHSGPTLKDMKTLSRLVLLALTPVGFSSFFSSAFADSSSENEQYLPPPVVQKEELKIAAQNDDMAAIVLKVKNDYQGPLTPNQLESYKQYVASREALRDDIRKYLPNIDYSQPNQTHNELTQAFKEHPDLMQDLKVFGRESALNLEKIQNTPKTGMPFLSAIIHADGFGRDILKTFAPGGSQSQASASAADHLLQGQLALSSGDNKAALKDAKAAAKMEPQNPSAQTLLAEAAFKTGDYPQAASAAQEILQKNPKDKVAMAIYGLSEGRNPRVDETSNSSAQNTSSPPLSNGSVAAQASGGINSNLSSKNLSGSSSSPATPLGLDAHLAFQMGNYRDALAGADRALKENPADFSADILAAQSYAGMGDYGSALKRVQAGLKTSPNNSKLLNLRSQLLSRQGHYHLGLAASDIVLEGNPQNAEGYYSRAMALAGLGDKKGVVESLKEAAKLDLKYQRLAEKAASLPLNSDLRLLFNQTKEGFNPIPKALGFHWGMILGLALLGLSGFVLLKRGNSDSQMEAQSPLPDSEGRTVILSENRIAGQYQITRRIGSGGMGLVYEGTDVNLGRRVAIKHLREDLQRNPQEKERFLSEARLVASLDHPNILRIYSIAEEKGEIYLIFEFIEGKTLDEWTQGRKLNLAQTLQVYKAVAQALDYAHAKGVIHRDMKPSNIMIGNNGVVHVMDFGVARLAKDPSLTSQMTRTIVGTPAYMAPETQDGFISKESDIYGLAVCVYQSLTGQLPFTATPSGTVNKIKRVYPLISSFGFPKGMDLIFNRALDPNPNLRFKSAREFISEMEKFSGVGLPV